MTSHGQNALNRAADRMVCRHLHLTAGKWTRKEEEPKYAPDRTCDVTHMKIEVSLRMEEHSAEMVCTQRLHAAYGPFDSIRLNAVDLEIRHVRDGRGRDLGYTYLDHVLDVRFPRPVRDEADLVISYRVVQPSDGLYFQEPEGDGHDNSRQLWSQGEMEGARHWIPCHDAPNERTTLEMHVTAPESCTVICNGRLTGVRKAGRKRRWSFHQAQTLPSYLISMVVGEYVRIEDEWNGIPVEYFVAPGLEEEARRSFGRTPEMMEFFSRLLGCPYPYDKYAQVTVRNFHFGGMENASTTTQTAGTLHDERAAIDCTSDDLVSHELAHQWFGDLVTCRSWTHAWLNEGFATYLEALWKEWDKGREEFDYEMVLNADSYMGEPYRRAISTPKYAHPFELFDMHLYPKAAWVLHMLRCHLGDGLFWKSVRLYLQRHANGTAETIDLIRACQDASGRNLERFFDQWIFSPGHPELEGEITWDEKASWIKVSLRQAQKREGGVPVFHIPVRVEACQGGDGSAPRLHGKTFEMDQAEQTFYLPVKAEPKYVVVDPEGAVLRTAKIKRPLEWVEAALTGLRRDERVPARVDLVRQLAEEAGSRSVRLLRKVLLEDPFWGVQAEAAASLGKLGSPAARDALIDGIDSGHPRTRRAVVTALGNFRDARVREALTAFVQGVDESYFVQSAALCSLGRSGGLEAAEELRAQLDEALERRDWHDTVALGAIQGLAATRDESAAPKLLEVAGDLSRYWKVRLAAMKGLAELGACRPILAPAIAEDLVRFLDDPRILISRRVPAALVTLGEQSAVGALRVRGEAAPVAESREAFLGAAEELAAKAGKSEDVDRLRTEMEKLREDARAMKQSLEAIQKKVMPDRKRKVSR